MRSWPPRRRRCFPRRPGPPPKRKILLRSGLAAAYADLSGDLADADRAEAASEGRRLSARTYEAVLEATYRAQIVAGLTVQPTFQYVWRPGGGFVEADDEEAPRRTRNAKVFGVATIVRF